MQYNPSVLSNGHTHVCNSGRSKSPAVAERSATGSRAERPNGARRAVCGRFRGRLTRTRRRGSIPLVTADRAPLAAEAPATHAVPAGAHSVAAHMVVSALLNAIYCIICDEVMPLTYGMVTCKGCNTQYQVKRKTLPGGVITSRNNILLAETQFRVYNSVEAKRTYLPTPSAKVIEYDASVIIDVEAPTFNPTTCILCKLPLASILSVEVNLLRFKDVEHYKTHPVSKLSYMEVNIAPSFRRGRAHPSCMDDPSLNPTFANGSRLAEPLHQRAEQPSQREHTRHEHWVSIDDAGRMRQRRGETWRDIPDLVEYDDA